MPLKAMNSSQDSVKKWKIFNENQELLMKQLLPHGLSPNEANGPPICFGYNVCLWMNSVYI
jgi:hypothetical protein